MKKADGGTETVNVDYMILALGSLPTKIPSLSIDSPRVMDSTGALDLPEIPKSLLVIGGGYIGLELGSVYAALGTKVSVVEMTPGLLPGADRDLVKFLAQRVEKTFDKVMVSTKVTSMKASDKSVTVNFEGEGAPKEATYDYVLVSIGRRPNAKIDGLDKTQVKVDAKGFIETDGQRRTAEPTIFAIGDVAGEPMLAHKASHEARVAVEAIEGQKAVFEPAAIPAVVFTDPEVAWAGLTEADAEKQGLKVEVAKFPWPASGRAIAIDRVDGMDEADHRSRDRAHSWRRHRRFGRRRTDRRRRCRNRDGNDSVGPETDDSPASDPERNAHGIGRSLLRPGNARLQAEEKGVTHSTSIDRSGLC